ncbi:MAG: FHA domain-containing protein [Anaerolineae bacterium]|nr:FHA domain-containing protein [Anaerolineae bacterium]
MTDPKKNIIRRLTPDPLPPQPAAQTALPQVDCPHCGKPNPEGDLYCFSCGNMLLTPGGTRRISAVQTVEIDDRSDAYFGDKSTLYLQVQGASEMIRVQPRKDGEMIIGRQSPDSVMIPDVDLSPYHAESQGVSRLHAAITRKNDTLILSDMGSLNHTHINQQRLHKHEVRVLNNGDELQFGTLVVRVHFRHG